jgi:hypothetical protein
VTDLENVDATGPTEQATPERDASGAIGVQNHADNKVHDGDGKQSADKGNVGQKDSDKPETSGEASLTRAPPTGSGSEENQPGDTSTGTLYTSAATTHTLPKLTSSTNKTLTTAGVPITNDDILDLLNMSKFTYGSIQASSTPRPLSPNNNEGNKDTSGDKQKSIDPVIDVLPPQRK